MSSVITINIPNAMLQSIDENCKMQKTTRQEMVRTAIARMLFEATQTEQHTVILPCKDAQSQDSSENVTYEIPLDKIVSVQYTLNDGKIINIMREKKTT